MPKKEENDAGPRLNEKITADIVRLVTEEGDYSESMYGLFSFKKWRY